MAAEFQRISCGSANAYLVRGGKGGILIDTGTAPYRERVLEACRSSGVRLILLTHGHVDHCQNAAFLAGALGCPVGIGREDAPLLAEGTVRPVTGRGLWGRLYAGISNRVIRQNSIPPHRPEVLLEAGMGLTSYGVDGEIVALPGHTAGSVGVLLSTGELFAGDAMQTVFGPATAWCYEDREPAERSAAAIRRMRPALVCCGHGSPTTSLGREPT